MIGEALLTHLSCFGQLSPLDAAAVRSIKGEVRTFLKHQDILRVGDNPATSMIVLKGYLCRYTISHDGSRQLQSFHMPTETPCLETLHIDYLDMNLAAVTDARVGEIEHSELNRVLDAHPKVLSLVWRETLIQAAISREWLMRNSSLPAHAAMAHLFCEIYVRAKAVRLVNENSAIFPSLRKCSGKRSESPQFTSTARSNSFAMVAW